MGKLKNKRKKQYAKLCMVFLMLFSCISTQLINVSAATYELGRDLWLDGDLIWISADDIMTYYGEWEDDASRGGRQVSAEKGYQGKAIWTLGNSYSYCIEPHINMNGSSGIYQDDETYDILRNTTRDGYTSTKDDKYEFLSVLLGLAPGSGVDASNTNEHIRWVAAQALVWEIVSGERYGNFEKVDPKGRWTSFQDIFQFKNASSQALYEQYYNDFVKKIQTYYTLPSFHDTTLVLDNYSNGIWSTNVTDTNNVLAYYDFSMSGYSLSKNGNVLTISTTDRTTSTSTGSITWNQAVFHTCAPVFWGVGEGIQRMVTVGSVNNPELKSSFSVQLGTGDLTIAKKDNYGNFIANTTFQISYYADMSKPIGTYTTDADGLITLSGLMIGPVYIQEISVPENLILDDTIHSVTVEYNKTVTYTATNQWKQGYIQVTKKDDKTKEVVKKAGTQFEILSGSTVVATITTDTTGIAKSGLLDYGTYTIREKTNPENYVIVTTTASTSILEDGKTYALEMYDTPVTGTINLSKIDSETGKTAQGDATIVGAQYALKANKDILNPSDGSVLYAKDEVISVKTVGEGTWGDIGNKVTDADGNIMWTNLPMGEYRIEEIEASTGYLLDVSHVVDLTSTANTKSVEVEDVESKEEVIKGRLEVIKTGNNGTSGVISGLENVEFTMKLYSEVQAVGWEQAKAYSVFTTDSTGRGISDEVPYGIYQVSETYTPDNYTKGGDFFVTIDEENEIELRIVNNTPFEAWLKIVKQDEDGCTVTLSNATFKVKDSEGNYVSQKVGLFFNKDEWTIDENGMVALDNMLLQGDYTIEEVKSPEGFLLADEVQVSISTDNPNLSFDEEGDPVITVYVTDIKPTGTIILHKTFENSEDNGVGSTTFCLTAVTDVMNPTDGSMIYYAGDVVDIEADGLYTVDENGQIVISGLPLGTNGATYQLEEVSTIDGYQLLESPIVFELTISNNTTSKYLVEKSVENQLTETYFSKTDIAGDEIEGAQLSLYDNTAEELVEEWISGTDAYLIKGLIYGHEYTLTEVVAPEGYVKAEAITFLYTTDMTKVTMLDKQVMVTKTDLVDGSFVLGAKLMITDQQTGEIVDQWITEEKPHQVSGLEEGKTYILTEMIAPNGYQKAESVEFRVLQADENGIKVNQLIEMKDQPILTDIQIHKIDSETNESILYKDFVFGLYADEACTELLLKVYGNTENATVTFHQLRYGTYYIKEIQAPQGYQLSDEVVKVIIDENLEGVGKTYSLDFVNVAIPEKAVVTSDQTSLELYCLLGVLSYGIFESMRRYKKKD